MYSKTHLEQIAKDWQFFFDISLINLLYLSNLQHVLKSQGMKITPL